MFITKLRTRGIAVLAIAVVASACQSIDPDHSTVRANALGFDGHPLDGSLEVGEVSPPESTEMPGWVSGALTQEQAHKALTQSLAGQGLLARNEADVQYLLDVDFHQERYRAGVAEPRAGVAVAYRLTDRDDGETLDVKPVKAIYSGHLNVRSIGRIDVDDQELLTAPLFEAEGRHHLGAEYVDIDPLFDRRLAYPQGGTPYHTTGDDRRIITREGALRAAIAEYLEYLRLDFDAVE